MQDEDGYVTLNIKAQKPALTSGKNAQSQQFADELLKWFYPSFHFSTSDSMYSFVFFSWKAFLSSQQHLGGICINSYIYLEYKQHSSSLDSVGQVSL